ncbi:MAG: hypothetical protein EON48_02435 [Acetobacteraceae bacterium]|nr:MAG: hypothetical protein EON48_02435 [Acetobacteraceae bacterium]
MSIPDELNHEALNEDEELSEEEMAEMLQAIEDAANAPPSPWLIAMGEAHECEAAFDWSGAEAAYRRAIAAEADRPSIQAKTYQDLAKLFSLIGLDEQDFEATKTATQLARQGNMPIMLPLHLRDEAVCYLDAGDLDRAEALLEEARGDTRLKVSHAYVLGTIARCRIARGDLEAAQLALDEIWQIIEPHSEFEIAAGWQGNFAAWWGLTAKMRAQRHDWPGAIAAQQERLALDPENSLLHGQPLDLQFAGREECTADRSSGGNLFGREVQFTIFQKTWPMPRSQWGSRQRMNGNVSRIIALSK